MQSRGSAFALGACFFLSGLGSLALEVVWTRELRLVFGSTTLAASTILVAYMLGLGSGGLIGGRMAARVGNGARAYGWIEVAIGLYALLVPWLLAQLPWLNRALLAGVGFWPAMLCRFAVSLALLLAPTVLMGATLPILVAALTRREAGVGASTGLLYGLNTLGAVSGVFAATFVLFPLLGLTWTNRFGALLDVAVGVVALLFVAPLLATAPREVPAAVPGGEAANRSGADLAGKPLATMLLVVYAVVGFTALLYEVAWTRALATVLGSSIYAFSAMLGAFLTGIALGSLAFRRWIDATRQPVALLACGIAVLAVLALGTTMLVPHLPSVLLYVVARGGVDAGRLVVVQVALCIAAMLPPTLVLGGLFPLVARLLAEVTDDVGRAVGRVYFANTVGSAAGAFATGFVLLPALGLRDTLALGAGLDLLAAALVLLASPEGARVRRWAAAPLAAAALLLVVPVPFDRQALTSGVFKAPEAVMTFGVELLPIGDRPVKELLFYEDGLNATVSVHREDGIVALRVNGKVDASSVGDMSTQVLLGEVPLLFGPPAKDVLVIGFASGVTVGSVAAHPEVERIDAVEIEPSIVEASRFFDALSGKPLEDPRVRLILDDARSYLGATRERYDLIISQPSNPWMSGVSNLFTRDFFRIVRGALAPGGRLLQWMQLYALDPPSLAAIVAALRAEFPYVYGFADFSGSPDVLFLAMDRPLERDDLPRWEQLPASVRDDLQRVGNFSTTDLWSLLRVTPADVEALAATAPAMNTDDNLLIELGTPWMMYSDTFIPNWLALASAEGVIVPLLERLGEPVDASVVGALALAHARKSSNMVEQLLRDAGKRGRSGRALATAVLVARSSDDGSLPLERQLATLDEALRLEPEATEVLLLRAEVRDQSGDVAGALADAEHALEVAPDDPRARAARMRALARLGRLEEARREADAVLATRWGASDIQTRREAAEIFRLTGDVDRAVALFEGLLYGGDPSWSEGWRLLGRAYSQQGDAARSAAAYKNARTARRNQALRYHRAARAARWHGKPKEAQLLLRAAVATDPEYAAARAELEQVHGPS